LLLLALPARLFSLPVSVSGSKGSVTIFLGEVEFPIRGILGNSFIGNLLAIKVEDGKGL
jgi:hypothetical protein